MLKREGGIAPEKELNARFNSVRRRKLEREGGRGPVKALELMSKDWRNVRFPRWGGRVPARWKAEIFNAVTRRCLVPQETPFQLQMETLEDQLTPVKTALGSEVTAFLKESRACSSVVRLKDEVSVKVEINAREIEKK